MTPVLQIAINDCFRACLASLLDLPVGEVPNFVGEDPQGVHWFDDLQAWLAPRGLAMIMSNSHTSWIPDGVPFIASVASPRRSPERPGLRHAIVMEFCGGQLVVLHDPTQDRGGVCKGTEEQYFVYFLVRRS